MSTKLTAEEALLGAVRQLLQEDPFGGLDFGLGDAADLHAWLKDRGYTVVKMTKEEFALHVYSSTKST